MEYNYISPNVNDINDVEYISYPMIIRNNIDIFDDNRSLNHQFFPNQFNNNNFHPYIILPLNDHIDHFYNWALYNYPNSPIYILTPLGLQLWHNPT